MVNKNISVEITKDEALVLFEFLSRVAENNELQAEHSSEEKVLANILCSLEEKLVEPLEDNYLELLNAARSRVSD